MAQGSKFSTGKYAKFASDRDGMKYDYSELAIEPDTKLVVHRDEVDEPDPYRRLRSRQDSIALRNPRPEPDLGDSAANLNGICLSQSAAGAQALTLNGNLVAGGVATLDVSGMPRNVVVTSNGNDLGIVFVIVGTILPGVYVTERLHGANSAAADSNNCFLTVTSVTTTGATASTVIVGIDAIGSEFETVDE